MPSIIGVNPTLARNGQCTGGLIERPRKVAPRTADHVIRRQSEHRKDGTQCENEQHRHRFFENFLFHNVSFQTVRTYFTFYYSTYD